MDERAKPVIKYKVSRNPRAAKLWNTSYLYNAMLQATQLKQDIEKVALEKESSIEDLDPTLIPTQLLWFIVDSYIDSYTMLMKESLIKSGNIHKISPTIN